jgi:chaperonin cofactor prefoldin
LLKENEKLKKKVNSLENERSKLMKEADHLKDNISSIEATALGVRESN